MSLIERLSSILEVNIKNGTLTVSLVDFCGPSPLEGPFIKRFHVSRPFINVASLVPRPPSPSPEIMRGRGGGRAEAWGDEAKYCSVALW